jgi:multidrug efflux pump subunit AcrA (membrane-fusion protein)
MPSQLYQVRNLYTDQRFDGFVLRAGKKARVRVEIERATDGRYRGRARLVEAGDRVVAEAEAETPDATIDAVIGRLYDTHFNFVARI